MAIALENNIVPMTTIEKSSLSLTPQVLEKLENLQKQAISAVSVVRPTPSKSADNRIQTRQIHPEKTTSLTLSERRNNISLQLQKPFVYQENDNKQSKIQISDKLVMKNLERQQKKTKKSEPSVTRLTDETTTDEDAWRDLIQQASTVEARREMLKRQMTGGIPTSVRGLVWKSLTQTSSCLISIYEDLLLETCPHATTIEEDVRQSDLDLDFQESVIRVLKAYSIYDPRVGYYQGMASLVIPLLMNMAENEAFNVLVRLFETYELRTLVMQDKKGLGTQLQQFQSVFAATLPTLETHLRQHHNMQVSTYAERWFLTAFMGQMPADLCMRLYDVLFLEGLTETVLRAGLVLLQHGEQHLMTHVDPLSVLTTDKLYACAYPADAGDGFVRDLLSIDASQLSVDNEDLATTVDRLRKENAALCQMHEMDQTKLAKRIVVLEKRVKKYKVKLANATIPSATTTTAVSQEDARPRRQYSDFVASLKETGDFGALIAGALAPSFDLDEGHQDSTESEEDDEETNKKRLDAALQNVTSELVAVKLDHFETQQRYETLYRHCQDLTRQHQHLQASQAPLLQKVMYLESELEDVQTERDQIYADQEEVLALAMVAKKTAAELQLEKMAIAKDMERLETQLKELQDEKKHFFMPRASFTEEVFAAHDILFGGSKQSDTRRHTLQLAKSSRDDEYKTKYVESELRCRELEKYLAEAKVKLAELECAAAVVLPNPRRTSLLSTKPSSTASLSVLAHRVSSPTSPRERRESTESYASSTTSLTSITSSNYNSKRSSMYSRIWNAFGSPNAISSTVQLKNDMMCEEPQIIHQ